MDDNKGYCETHSRTMKEINELREENKKIRHELNELKKIVNGFKELERKIAIVCHTREQSLWKRILNFLMGNKNKEPRNGHYNS